MKLQWIVRREVRHGGVIPHGCRMAWYEPQRRLGVYYPRPIHWLLRVVREVTYRARLAVSAPSLECREVFEMQRRHRERERLAEEYAQGYMVGWRECFQACLEVVEDEIGCVHDAYDVKGWFNGGANPPREN